MEKNFLKILAVIVGLSFFIFWLYFAVFSLDIKTGTWSKKIRSEKERNDIILRTQITISLVGAVVSLMIGRLIYPSKENVKGEENEKC